MLLKTKGRKEICSSEPEPNFPNGANSDILGQTKSKLPTEVYFRFCLQSVCTSKKSPSQKKCVIIVAIENAKKCCIVTIMRYAIVLSFSLQQFSPGDMGPWIFSAKRDVILRFRQISFNMPKGFYAHGSLIRFRNRDAYMYC